MSADEIVSIVVALFLAFLLGRISVRRQRRLRREPK